MPRKNKRAPRATRGGRRENYRRGKPKPCAVCAQGGALDWKDASFLRKFVSDRGKIRSRRVSGLCPRDQRRVATAVKSAREMALLPYVGTR